MWKEEIKKQEIEGYRVKDVIDTIEGKLAFEKGEEIVVSRNLLELINKFLKA